MIKVVIIILLGKIFLSFNVTLSLQGNITLKDIPYSHYFFGCSFLSSVLALFLFVCLLYLESEKK